MLFNLDYGGYLLKNIYSSHDRRSLASQDKDMLRISQTEGKGAEKENCTSLETDCNKNITKKKQQGNSRLKKAERMRTWEAVGNIMMTTNFS